MKYRCAVCGKEVEGDVKAYIDHTETHIVEEIQKKHPDWVEADGICPKCYAYYKSQLKGH